MKGALETELLMAIIIVIALFLVLVVIAINPTFSQGTKSGEQIEFGQFCFHWGLNSFAYDGTNSEIRVGETSYNIDEYCGRALSRSSVTLEDIEACRKLCRGSD